MEKSKEKKEKKFNYKEQFGVIVICETELQQIEVFNDLSKKKVKAKSCYSMKIEIKNESPDFKSYRASRVKSLFNAESNLFKRHLI